MWLLAQMQTETTATRTRKCQNLLPIIRPSWCHSEREKGGRSYKVRPVSHQLCISRMVTSPRIHQGENRYSSLGTSKNNRYSSSGLWDLPAIECYSVRFGAALRDAVCARRVPVGHSSHRLACRLRIYLWSGQDNWRRGRRDGACRERRRRQIRRHAHSRGMRESGHPIPGGTLPPFSSHRVAHQKAMKGKAVGAMVFSNSRAPTFSA
jgi:hypothetical protein